MSEAEGAALSNLPLHMVVGMPASQDLKQHTKHVCEFLESVSEFVSKKVALEKQALASLQQLIETHRKQMESMNQSYRLSDYAPSLYKLWTSFVDFSNQEHQIKSDGCNEILSVVVNGINDVCTSQKQVAKKIFDDRKNIDNDITKEQENVKKSLKDYNDAYKEKKKASTMNPAVCNNAHNEYFLTVSAASANIALMYSSYIPELMDHVHNMHVRMSRTLGERMQAYSEIIKEQCEDVSTAMDAVHQYIPSIDATADIDLFAKLKIVDEQYRPPADLAVEVVNPDLSSELYVHESTLPALQNKASALRTEKEQVQARIDILKRQLAGLESLFGNYSANNKLGNPDTVLEQLIDSRKQLRELVLKDKAFEVQLGLLDAVKGQVTACNNPHQFVPDRATLGKCVYCGSTFTDRKCNTCKCVVHEKCMLLIPQECSGPPAVSDNREKKLKAVGSTASLRGAPVVRLDDPDAAPTVARYPKQRKPMSMMIGSSDDADESYRDRSNTAPLKQTLIAIALYDYDATKEDELTLQMDDKIIVTDSTGNDWWEGESSRGKGFFPKSYVRVEVSVPPPRPQRNKPVFTASESFEEEQGMDDNDDYLGADNRTPTPPIRKSSVSSHRGYKPKPTSYSLPATPAQPVSPVGANFFPKPAGRTVQDELPLPELPPSSASSPNFGGHGSSSSLNPAARAPLPKPVAKLPSVPTAAKPPPLALKPPHLQSPQSSPVPSPSPKPMLQPKPMRSSPQPSTSSSPSPQQQPTSAVVSPTSDPSQFAAYSKPVKMPKPPKPAGPKPIVEEVDAPHPAEEAAALLPSIVGSGEALYDYDPRNDDEIAIRVGDVLEILSVEVDGWSRVKLLDKEGLVPTNYYEMI